MTHRVDAPEQAIDFNNENSNTSANPTFDAVLSARLSRRGDETFPTASLIKVPILVTLYDLVEKGKISLEDPLTILSIDKVPGSGVMQFLHDGAVVTVVAPALCGQPCAVGLGLWRRFGRRSSAAAGVLAVAVEPAQRGVQRLQQLRITRGRLGAGVEQPGAGAQVLRQGLQRGVEPRVAARQPVRTQPLERGMALGGQRGAQLVEQGRGAHPAGAVVVPAQGQQRGGPPG